MRELHVSELLQSEQPCGYCSQPPGRSCVVKLHGQETQVPHDQRVRDYNARHLDHRTVPLMYDVHVPLPDPKPAVAVYTIEFVVPMRDQQIGETLNRALEELQCIGSAEIIDRRELVNTFSEASAILAARGVLGKSSG